MDLEGEDPYVTEGMSRRLCLRIEKNYDKI